MTTRLLNSPSIFQKDGSLGNEDSKNAQNRNATREGSLYSTVPDNAFWYVVACLQH